MYVNLATAPFYAVGSLDRSLSLQIYQMSAKDKIDAIFLENRKSILDSPPDSDAGDMSNSSSMLDILAMYNDQRKVATEPAKIISLKPKKAQKLMFGSTKELMSKATVPSDRKTSKSVELVLDIKSSKSMGQLKFPKV